MVQGATVTTRGASTATTGGLANPIFATIELAGATVTSLMALLAPVLAALLVIVSLCLVGGFIVRRFRKAPPTQAAVKASLS